MKRRHSDETIMPISEDGDAGNLAPKLDRMVLNNSPEVISLLEEEEADFLSLPRTSRRSATTGKFLPTPDNSDGMSSKGSQNSSTEEVSGSVFVRSHLRRESLAAKDMDFEDVEEVQDQDDDWYDFVIPELPKGRELLLVIKSNWGDDDSVGLNGLEVFDANTCDLAKIDKVS